jgi:hypothetical protein
MPRADLMHCKSWKGAFANHRKDHRFYELVEETTRQGFDYWYFVIRDETGAVRGFQPFFVLDQDLLAGIEPNLPKIVHSARRLWPRCLTTRTLWPMVRRKLTIMPFMYCA